MTDLLALQAMISMLADATATAILHVDNQGNISFLRISGRSEKVMQRYQGKSIFRFLNLVKSDQEALRSAFQQCADFSEPAAFFRFPYRTIKNANEYLDLHFQPGPQKGSVIIQISNVSEDVAIEKEFQNIFEQSEITTRDLHAAISSLDFRLMELDLAYKKFAALYRITSIVQRTVNEQEVMDEMVEGIATELGFPVVAIILDDAKKRELVVKASRGYFSNCRIAYGDGIVWRAVSSRELVFVSDVSQDEEYLSTGDTSGVSEVAIPLIFAGKAIGALDIKTFEDRPIKPYDLDLLRSLAGQIALTIVHAQQVARIQIEAVTDALTGLYNYRYFLNLLEREYKRAVRYKRPLALLMVDIDYFKRYNDTYGHPMGNKLLQQMSEVIKSQCRDVDLIARYGGEEFTVLLPETNLSDAFFFAERIRLAIAKHFFPGKHTQPGGEVTISVGISAFPEDASNDKELLEHADSALYSAKRASRNCVVSYSKPGPVIYKKTP